MERLLGQLATTADHRSDADAVRMALGRESRIDRLGGGMSAAARRRSILTRAVELDVIPQLLVAKRTAPPVSTCLEIVTASEVAELVTHTLAPLEAATSGFVQAMLETGVAPETLYLDLLTPAARKLGDMWTEDVCDFTEVTIGVWRLWNALRALSPAFLGPVPAKAPPAGRVLLVPLPGEQHSFGLSMVFDFFRRAGWSVWTGPLGSRGVLAAWCAPSGSMWWVSRSPATSVSTRRGPKFGPSGRRRAIPDWA